MQAGGGQREKETESEAGSKLWAVSTKPNVGLELTNCKIMTWAEVGFLANWTTQAPQQYSIVKILVHYTMKRINHYTYKNLSFRNVYFKF